jgi:hypothetical protein
MPSLRFLGPLLIALSMASPGARGAGEPGGELRWEYRVLSKEQVIDLGNKDLLAGLNRLGSDRWELAAVDGSYIFKRRMQASESLENKKRRLAFAQDNVDQRRERVAWSERMVRKGFLSDSQLQTERALLAQAELALDQAHREFDAHVLPPPNETPRPKTPPKQ